MKKLLTLLLFLAGSGLFAQDSLPAVNVNTLDGKTGSFPSFIKPGKPTVVFFWATWSKPSHEALDNLNKIYARWQKEYNVEIVAVALDEGRYVSKISPIAKQKGWQHTILSDPNGDLKRALGINSMPVYLLVKNGTIVSQKIGYTAGDEAEWEEEIKELAGQ